jgi:hypothetical protein
MLLGFVVGIVLALATQSSATVTVIAMATASAGLMTLQGAMMTLYGASVGSGVSTYLIATSMRGKARQLAILQVMVKALGIAVLLPLFVIEHYFGQPLLAHAITAATADPSLQIAIVYAVIQFVSVLAQEALNRPLWPLIVLLSPASAEDALSTPKYLYAQAREDPETALTLIDREQARVFSLLPLYIGKADAWSESEPVPPRSAILPGAKSLLAALDRFLGELSDTGASRDAATSPRGSAHCSSPPKRRIARSTLATSPCSAISPPTATASSMPCGAGSSRRSAHFRPRTSRCSTASPACSSGSSGCCGAIPRCSRRGPSRPRSPLCPTAPRAGPPPYHRRAGYRGSR